MHCLEIIKKMNDQAVKDYKKSGSFKFDKKAGCNVYQPPGLNGNEKTPVPVQSVKGKG